MKLIPKSLAARLTLFNAAVILTFFAVAFPVLYLLVEAALVREMDADLAEDIDAFRELFADDGLQAVAEEIGREMASDAPDTVFYRVLDSHGRILLSRGLSAGGEPTPDLRDAPAGVSGNELLFRTLVRSADGREQRVVAGQIGPDQILQIGDSMGEHRELMNLVLHLFTFLYLLMIPFSALLGWLMSRYGLRGIDMVRQAAEEIAGGNLKRRVPVSDRGSEIERLARSFNAMADRVGALITGMREMTDNIAHDMKSPLARIRANLELALTSATTLDAFRSAAADTVEDCDRMQQMIDATLSLAEAEAGTESVVRERVNLGDVAAAARELFEPVAEDKGIELSVSVDTDCTVVGHLQHLQRMLANLVDNGIKYTEGPGAVEIRIGAAEGAAFISVRDTGIGIPEEDRERVFERFFRGEKSRSGPGFGLGLSFCRAVARSHGGDIEVSSALGQGSVFTATLRPFTCC